MNAGGSARRCRQVLPNLVASETHDRRQQPHQSLSQLPQRSLSRPPSHRPRRRCVQAVLQYVEVHGTQIDNAEILELLIEAMKNEGVIVSSYIARNLSRLQ